MYFSESQYLCSLLIQSDTLRRCIQIVAAMIFCLAWSVSALCVFWKQPANRWLTLLTWLLLWQQSVAMCDSWDTLIWNLPATPVSLISIKTFAFLPLLLCTNTTSEGEETCRLTGHVRLWSICSESTTQDIAGKLILLRRRPAWCLPCNF